MNPLHQVPPKLRSYFYWVGYVVGVIGQGTTVVWAAIAAADPGVEMPLALVITSAVLGLAQTQLNLLAGSNIPSLEDVLSGEAKVGHEYSVDADDPYTPEHRAEG